MIEGDTGSCPALSALQMQDALERVLASAGFERGERLGDFLAYVVREEIAGRGEAIRGKTIAQDVYGRSPQERGDPDNLVRVDARRLRQQLEHYYGAAGAGDPVHIHLDPGSYRPRFETVRDGPAQRLEPWVVRSAVSAGLFALGALLGFGLTVLLRPGPSLQGTVTVAQPVAMQTPQGSAVDAAQRTAIMRKSPASLEAISLAEQGQRMLFPIFDLPRMALLTSVFERVAELDPDYFGGHAGLAQVLSIRSVLTAQPESRAALLADAKTSADTALRLAPAEPWTQIASALVAFASNDCEDALRTAELAADLRPEDGQIMDSLGAIALFCGAFDRAIQAANGGRPREGSNQRFANRNIFAAASFHVGNYRDSFETFDEAAAFGDPLSAPSLAYQAAALVAAGRKGEASEKLDNLKRAWPDAPLEAMLYGVHRKRENADAVLDRLREVGWPNSSPE